MATGEAIAEVSKEHNFFSTLSTQLWSIERHPFSRIGGTDEITVERPKD